jgi:hypothetical protein
VTWNRKAVAERIREACDTLRRLPEQKVRGYFSTWPLFVSDMVESALEGELTTRLAAASPRAIDRMHETFGWFVHLQDKPHLAAALWLTCGRGLGPSRASRIIGAHRDTVRHRRDEALDRVVRGLNETRRAA